MGGVVPVVGYGGKYDVRTTVLFTVLLPSPCRKEDVRTVSFSLAPPPLVRAFTHASELVVMCGWLGGRPTAVIVLRDVSDYQLTSKILQPLLVPHT
jgi:hypothetical protein